MGDVGIVLIGRNEGRRLAEALAAALAVGGAAARVVYVDSGSTDGSAALARGKGVEVVELDASSGLSAARARNAGFAHLSRGGTVPRWVQFVDGDCVLEPGWLKVATDALSADDDTAVVCGRRRERYPHASIYHALIDREWDTPVGEARSCGGDAMFRADALAAVGGYDATIVAGEEPELCMRLRARGWKVRRLDADMTHHDAAIFTLRQWLRREVRTGYGSLDVARRFGDPHFARMVRRARWWGIGWPAAVVVGGVLAGLAGGPALGAAAAGVLACVWPAAMARMILRKRRAGWPWRLAVAYAGLTLPGKWAQLVGQWRYHRDRAGRRGGGGGRLIEYKREKRLATDEPGAV